MVANEYMRVVDKESSSSNVEAVLNKLCNNVVISPYDSMILLFLTNFCNHGRVVQANLRLLP